MKNVFRKMLFALLVLVLGVSGACAATSVVVADTLAFGGKFAEAAEAYEAILAEGNESASVYYNLGYCYAQQHMLGKAIVNFERSRKLNPADPDVAANLEILYSQTDKMQVVEPIFFQQWWSSLKHSLSSDAWAALFVFLFCLAVAGAAAFFFASSLALRKVGFFAGLALLLVALFAVSFSLDLRSELVNGSEGVIMASSVNLSTSPDKNGSLMAVLHEGTHVDVIDQIGDWIEVRLVDGNVGWLKSDDVEMF